MNDDIIQCIKLLQERKAEIDVIDRKIDEERTAFEGIVALERKKFEESLNPLKEEVTKLSMDFDTIGQNVVPITLGDLVKELATLSGVDVSNIGIEIKSNVEFWGKNSLNKILELFSYKNIQGRWAVVLTDKSTSNPLFCYKMTFKLNLNAIQADGKTFLAHCMNEIRYDSYLDKYYTILCVGRNRDDIILNIPLNSLFKKDHKGICDEQWYPTDLMMQAVINCVERSQEEEIPKDNVKKRSRKLLDETKKVGVND